jgi:Tfp pilus assembly protein PilF
LIYEGCLPMKGQAMPKAQRHYLWRTLAFAAALIAIPCLGANAKDSSASLKDAEQYVAKGDLKAAEIELRNAVRQSPDNPIIRARLAQVYLGLGDAASAEREARAARERNGEEADYLPILADALLRQGKFTDVLDLIQPGDRAPALESKVRTALGTAAAGLNDRNKAEAMLRDAIRLDPEAEQPKAELAQVLSRQNPEEADKLIDTAIAANPRSTQFSRSPQIISWQITYVASNCLNKTNTPPRIEYLIELAPPSQISGRGIISRAQQSWRSDNLLRPKIF